MIALCAFSPQEGACGADDHGGDEGRDVPTSNSPHRIEIHKAKRELRLLAGETLVATFPVGLGFEPVDDKRRQGDGATPEGDYFVCVKNPQSRSFLSLGISYPSAADAERGVERGLVSTAEAERIAAAEARGGCPPWDTALGGTIYIHGRGASSDWTLGCIALDDADMERLYGAARIGTRVSIRP